MDITQLVTHGICEKRHVHVFILAKYVIRKAQKMLSGINNASRVGLRITFGNTFPNTFFLY